jgi:hypothetical protein
MVIPGLGVMGLLFMPGAMTGRRRWAQRTLLLLLALGLLACVAGCGNSRPAPTPPTAPLTPVGNYSVTVTATSGASSHSGMLTLVVQ